MPELPVYQNQVDQRGAYAILTTALNDQITFLHAGKGVTTPPVVAKPRRIITPDQFDSIYQARRVAGPLGRITRVRLGPSTPTATSGATGSAAMSGQGAGRDEPRLPHHSSWAAPRPCVVAAGRRG